MRFAARGGGDGVEVDGSGTSNCLNFTVSGPQSITGVSPAVGPVGTTVTITGSGFGASGAVMFNGVDGRPTSWSDGSITVPVPAGATTGNVVVIINSLPNYPASGQWSNGISFTVSPALVTYTIATSPPGRSITVDGTNYTSPYNAQWCPGSQHMIAISATQVNGSTQYLFSNWSDGGALSHSITAPSSSTAYTASFTIQYYLTTGVTGGGAIQPASGWYNAGAMPSVSAQASSGYVFSGFSGSLGGATTPQNLTMNAAASVTAAFAQLFTQNIVASPAGPPLTVDGGNCPAPCILAWGPAASTPLLRRPPSPWGVDRNWPSPRGPTAERSRIL